MPSSDKPKKQAKPRQSGAAKKTGAAAKQPLKTAKAKTQPSKTAANSSKSVVKTAAGMAAGVLMSTDTLKDLVSNMLYDLLKAGWSEAAPVFADMLHKLPLLQFSTLRGAAGDTVEAPPIDAAYEEWIDSLVTVALHFRKRATEVRQMSEEWGMSYRQIADFAGGRLADAAAAGKRIEAETLMSDIRAHFHHCYLQAVVGPATAPDRPGIRV